MGGVKALAEELKARIISRLLGLGMVYELKKLCLHLYSPLVSEFAL
jgi:hypothetical protein